MTNEFQGELAAELTAENMQAEHLESPAETWQKIKDLMEVINVQVKELEADVRDLKKAAFSIEPKF